MTHPKKRKESGHGRSRARAGNAWTPIWTAAWSGCSRCCASPPSPPTGAFAAECRRAGQWLRRRSRRARLRRRSSTRRRATPSSPPRSDLGAKQASDVLRPLRRAAGRPAEPVDHAALRAGAGRRAPTARQRIVGRGTADDKGQVMTFIEACRAYLAVTGTLPVDVTFLLEGEEESGSINTPGFVAANKEALAADVALVCDTNMWDARDPGDHRPAARPRATTRSWSRPRTATCIPAIMAARRATPCMCCRRSSRTCMTRPAASPFPASMTMSARRPTT